MWILSAAFLVNLMEESRMVCKKCGKEMRKGYLFSSKDGAFSFANEVPGVFENMDSIKKVNPTYTASFKER